MIRAMIRVFDVSLEGRIYIMVFLLGVCVAESTSLAWGVVAAIIPLLVKLLIDYAIQQYKETP